MFPAIFSMLFSGFATGLSMYSQVQQGKVANQVAQYNAGLIDAEVANKNAEFSQGVARERINQERHLASIQAQIASSGVQGTTGTPLNIVGDTSSAFQTSIADAARNTSIQVAAMRQKQAMIRYGGQSAQAAAPWAALGTGLSGGASMANTFSNNQNLGIF